MLRNADNVLHRQIRIARGRRLMYGGMRLIPVEDGSGLSDKWHLPGGEIASTDELVRRAKCRDVTILVVE